MRVQVQEKGLTVGTSGGDAGSVLKSRRIRRCVLKLSRGSRECRSDIAGSRIDAVLYLRPVAGEERRGQSVGEQEVARVRGAGRLGNFVYSKNVIPS